MTVPGHILGLFSLERYEKHALSDLYKFVFEARPFGSRPERVASK